MTELEPRKGPLWGAVASLPVCALVGLVAGAAELGVTQGLGDWTLDRCLYFWGTNTALATAIHIAVAAISALVGSIDGGHRWLPVRSDPALAARRLAAGAVGVVCLMGLGVPWVAWIEPLIATRWLRAAVVTLGVGGVSVLAIAVVVGLARALESRPLPRPKIAIWVMVGVGLAIATVGIVASGSFWLQADLRVPGGVVTVAALHAGSVRAWRPSRRRLRFGVALIVWLVVATAPWGVGPVARLAAGGFGHAWLFGWQSRWVASWWAGADQPGDHRSDEPVDRPAPVMEDPKRPAPSVRTVGPGVARHLLLISVDTLRADHLSLFGYARPTDPNIRAFFEAGVRFSRCYTPAPHSIPAIAGLITGLSPARLRWSMAKSPYPEPDHSTTLAEMLRTVGFGTHFVTYTNFFLSAGTRQGFDSVGTNPIKRGKGVTPWRMPRDGPMAKRAAELIGELAQEDRRHFIWLHFIAPHEPYLAHPDLPSWGGEPVDRYDGEIRSFDAAFASLTKALDETGWLEHTAVVLVADHGEAFRHEHGNRHHGRALFEEEVRVPCLFRAPGLLPRTIDAPVSLLDVLPTSLELLGLRASLPLDGISLLPAMRGQTIADGRAIVLTRFAVGKMRRLDHAVVMGTRKGFFSRAGRGIGWYDLGTDPAEKQRRPPDAAPMRPLGEALSRWQADIDGRAR